jgi:hypothetical protein
MAAYTCLLRICCLAANVVSFFVSKSLPSNGSTRYIAPSLRPFAPNSLHAYRHFFLSEGWACDICDWPHFSLPWLDSHGDYSPTPPSLKSLVPSGSLIRCQSVQVYHHHPRLRAPLDPAYHIIYPGYCLVRALPWGLRLGRFPLTAGWAIEPHSVALVVARAVGQEFSSRHWPASGAGGHNCGWHVDGPLNLQHDRLWVVPFREVPQTASRTAVGVPLRTLG